MRGPAPVHGPGRRQARFGNMFASDMRRSGGRFGGSASRQFEGAGATRGLTPLTPASGANAGNGGYTQEQRIADRARLYESALQKSIATAPVHRRTTSGGAAATAAGGGGANTHEDVPLDEEDLRSNLEDSYIDGTTRRVAGGLDQGGFERRNDDEDELADGGVMGLLTQIYDNRRRAI